MIELKNVSKYYNNNGVVTLGLRNINLNFDKNEIVAIVGESGSGKSTLLNVICGVDSYEEGEIIFDGYETSYFNQEDMDIFRRVNVSFIYQNYNVIDAYTVLENVMFPLLINGVSKKEAKARALELIDRVGLSKRIHHRGTKLSGGEKQRCVIARALALDCPILACDEPTGNLDSKTGEEIINLIKDVAKDKLVLIVTHNYEQVEKIVTRTIKMSDGEVISDDNVNNNVASIVNDGDIFSDDKKKLKYKVIADIGFKNLKSTPKKNIFIFLVLLILSFIGLFLFMDCVSGSINANYTSYNGFLNDDRDRIIVYDKEHNSFDANIFSDYESYINAFYEDNFGMLYLKENRSDVYFYSSVSVTKHIPSSISDLVGTKEISNNKFLLVLPSYSYYSSDVIDFILENKLVYYIYDKSDEHELELVGCAKSANINNPIMVVDDDFLKTINAYKTGFDLPSAIVDSNSISLDLEFADISKPKLELINPGEVEKINLQLSSGLYDFNINVDDCDIEYGKGNNKIYIPYSHIAKDCYELTIYTNNTSKIEKLASENNLDTIIPSKSGINILSFSFLSFVFSIIISSLIMIFLVFISYVVLQKVYQSRRRDYAIMRSLGMVKSQMAKVIRFEIITLGFIASILSLILLTIIAIVTKVSFSEFVVLVNPITIICYILFMMLFNLRLANKFNKKLFKFSVTKTIKEVF